MYNFKKINERLNVLLYFLEKKKRIYNEYKYRRIDDFFFFFDSGVFEGKTILELELNIITYKNISQF